MDADDAGCLSVFDDLRETDNIPNISALAAEGLSAELESQTPPWTPSAWPSIYTGVNPGKHGVYGFVTFDGYDWEVSTADRVRERTVRELLDDHGRSSVVVNAPVTYPPTEFGEVAHRFAGSQCPNRRPFRRATVPSVVRFVDAGLLATPGGSRVRRRLRTAGPRRFRDRSGLG